MVIFEKNIQCLSSPLEDRVRPSELKLICLGILRLGNVVRQLLQTDTSGLVFFCSCARTSRTDLQHSWNLWSEQPPIHKAGALEDILA